MSAFFNDLAPGLPAGSKSLKHGSKKPSQAQPVISAIRGIYPPIFLFGVLFI